MATIQGGGIPGCPPPPPPLYTSLILLFFLLNACRIESYLYVDSQVSVNYIPINCPTGVMIGPTVDTTAPTIKGIYIIKKFIRGMM